MSEDELIEANPCKLRNGNWGCKTSEPVNIGDTVRIVTRANKQWRARITQIVWSDDQVCICETASENDKAADEPQAGAAKPSAARPSSGNARTTTATAATPAPANATALPPGEDDIPTDDLDAMADRAAEQDDEFDDLMNAMQEFERNQQ